MNIVVSAPGGERDIELTVAGDATIGELVRSVVPGAEPDLPVTIDDRPVPPGRRIDECGLWNGSMVAVGAPLVGAPPVGNRARIGPGVVGLCILSGPGAGMSVRLEPGRYVLGSGPEAHLVLRAPGVAGRHAVIGVGADGAVALRSLPDGSDIRVPAEATVRVGACLISFRRVPDGQRDTASLTDGGPVPVGVPGPRGTVRFNRPPHPLERRTPPVLQVPSAPPAPERRQRFGVAGLVVPLLFGLVLAVLIHPRMAVFALLGPVMMGAGWLDDRRRIRGHRRRSRVEAAETARGFGAKLDRLRTAERRRRWSNAPSVAELVDTVIGTPRMWERRPGHPRFMQLVAGYGDARWCPRLDGDLGAAAHEVREAVKARSWIAAAPVTVDLAPGRTLGVAGERRVDALALVAGLVCQAAVLHGPADVRIAVITNRPDDWAWVKWLPHTIVDLSSGRRLLAGDDAETDLVIAAIRTSVSPDADGGATRRKGEPPMGLVIIDGEVGQPQMEGARQPGDQFLPDRLFADGTDGSLATIVLVPTVEQLPARCTAVAVTTGPGMVLLTDLGTPTGATSATHLAIAGAVPRVAAAGARSLARFEDPELDAGTSPLGRSVRLLSLLGLEAVDGTVVAERWRRPGAIPPVPIGRSASGDLILDLVADGPHGLIAGTTGSGKSELLRTVIASLAASVGPDRLTFVLIDYKGGSAFDACRDFPHTVGLVTDLDGDLAERALQCLEAELRHRETQLRAAGVGDIGGYPGTAVDPLPRMLVVIDEFAALAKELPHFIDALVDIGARGRSLGIHLLLATQRPAGVVRDQLRANTNLRIALRVNDRTDSLDVLDDPGAASIGRRIPGRGFLRLGPGELIAFQTAIVSTTGADEAAKITWHPFGFAAEQEAPIGPSLPGDTDAVCGPTDLERLVAATLDAAAECGIDPPRRPWPDPLPAMVTPEELDTSRNPDGVDTDRVDPDDVGADGCGIAVAWGLVDEPERQRRRTAWWTPEDGSLLVYGSPGSGTTGLLATIATGLIDGTDASRVHLYVIDCDGGKLLRLDGFPHVGGVIGPGDRERQIRLLRMLTTEIDIRRTRRGSHPESPLVVVLIDDIGSFGEAFGELTDAAWRESMVRIVIDGPAVGVVSIVTARRPGAVPAVLAGTVARKLLFRLVDPVAAAGFGIRRSLVDLPVGRAIDPASGSAIQVAHRNLDRWAAAHPLRTGSHRTDARGGGPAPVDTLPEVVQSAEIAAAASIAGDTWFIPLGLGDTTRQVIGQHLGDGDHLLIAGEPRSGRSSLLASISAVMSECDPALDIRVVALRSSPLQDLPGVDHLVTDPGEVRDAVRAVLGVEGRRLVLIDDVDDIDECEELRHLVTARQPGLRVVGVGRRDLKTRYRHWALDLCRSRRGVWLRPSPGSDTDLWSTPMPRRVSPGMPAGRGFLVAEGTVEVIQAAMA